MTQSVFVEKVCCAIVFDSGETQFFTLDISMMFARRCFESNFGLPLHSNSSQSALHTTNRASRFFANIYWLRRTMSNRSSTSEYGGTIISESIIYGQFHTKWTEEFGIVCVKEPGYMKITDNPLRPFPEEHFKKLAAKEWQSVLDSVTYYYPLAALASIKEIHLASFLNHSEYRQFESKFVQSEFDEYFEKKWADGMSRLKNGLHLFLLPFKNSKAILPTCDNWQRNSYLHICAKD